MKLLNLEFNLSVKDKKVLLSLIFLCYLYVYPIIFADYPYIDDVKRQLEGGGWSDDGRIIATLLYSILSFGTKLLDLSPLTQFFSIFFLSFSSFLLYKYFLSSLPLLVAILISFLFSVNPFFLQNISYKYDSFTMSLAVLLSVIAFCIGTENKIKYNLLWSCMILLLSLLLYQPVLVIFINLNIIYFISKGIDSKQYRFDLIFLFKMSIVTIMGYLLYVLISSPFISGWIKTHNQPVNIFTKEGIELLKLNLIKSLALIGSFFKDYITIILFFIPFFISSFYIIYLPFKGTIKKGSIIYRCCISVLLILIPGLLFIIVSMPILFMEYPVVLCRVLVGFSTILFFSFLVLSKLIEKFVRLKFLYFLMIFPVLYMLTLSYSYGNASKAQKEFEQNIIISVVQDVGYLNKLNTINSIVFLSANPKYSPRTRVIINKFPILGKMMNPFYWTEYHTFITQNYIKNHPIFSNLVVYSKNDIDKKILNDLMRKDSDKENSAYKLKIIDDIVFVEYK